MPARILAGLIAHELAHVVQFVRLGCFTLPDGWKLEIEADTVAKGWGFAGRSEIEAEMRWS